MYEPDNHYHHRNHQLSWSQLQQQQRTENPSFSQYSNSNIDANNNTKRNCIGNNNEMFWLDHADLSNYQHKIPRKNAIPTGNLLHSSEELLRSLHSFNRPFNDAFQSQDSLYSLVSGVALGKERNSRSNKLNQNFSLQSMEEFLSGNPNEGNIESSTNGAFANRTLQNAMINRKQTISSMLALASPVTDQASVTSLENVNNLIKTSRLLSGEHTDFCSNWSSSQQLEFNRVSFPKILLYYMSVT